MKNDDTAPRRLHDLPTWVLARANARAHRLLQDALADRSMRGYHFRVLATLDEDGPSSQATIGHRTGIDRSDMVAVVRDLIARGLLERAPHATDRRRYEVAVTDAGRTALAELDTVIADVQKTVLAPLNDDERDVLLALLRRLDVDRSPSR